MTNSRSAIFVASLFLMQSLQAQHDHQKMPAAQDAHLAHIQACRKETLYIDSLPEPVIMTGIGKSDWKIQTRSEKTQAFFAQGIALLHCFWDFEAYRSFKVAISNDTAAVMPYWGMYYTIGQNDNPEFKKDRDNALEKLKTLKDSVNEKEKLYVEAMLALSDKENEDGFVTRMEQIVNKYPDEVDALLFLSLNNMAGFDPDMQPRKGHLYSRYILSDLLAKHPDNAGANHYWIHQMENCCPEEALAAAIKLSQIAPKSGHMVHMPGHIYYRLGNYEKAHESFVQSMRVDSAYMKDQGIREVDTWNYIHNLNYLIGNCVEDGRYKEGLVYSEKLKSISVEKGRKKTYQTGSFFSQGVMAPAIMELRFGFYDRAVSRLGAISNLDTVFLSGDMNFKDALTIYARGMDALSKNKIDLARGYSNELDGYLWRNGEQSKEGQAIKKWQVPVLNVASLELQGLVKSYEGKYEEALVLLNDADERERKLGYSEPPAYHRPVVLSIAATHLRVKKYDLAIECYEKLLKRFPNSAAGLAGMANVYKTKGDKLKSSEWAEKLKNTVKWGDKELYVVK